MKKSFVLSLLLLQGFCSHSQTTDTAARASLLPGNVGMAVHKLKSNNAVLPRWTLDLTYRFGALSQEIELIDLRRSYTGSREWSHFDQPGFSSGRTSGGDVHLGYFFNKERTLGLSIGGMYLQHTGTLTLDSFYSDFNVERSPDTVYRQIIHTNRPVTEDIRITNINIPVLLQFKHQFGTPANPSNFGITAALGGLFGIANETRTQQASGSFSYEAIYKLSPDKRSYIVGVDDRREPDNDGSFVFTEKKYMTDDPLNINQHFDVQRKGNDLYNIGLYKNIAESQRTGNASYNKIGLGGMVQLGLSYSLAYNVSFLLSGYYMYQSWTATDNESYRPTDKVVLVDNNSYGNYSVMTSGVKKSDYSGYGLSAGFRIFFGEKRDVDGDKVPDAIDKCKLDFGEARFNGCPDTDGDGIVDNQDACKFETGPEYTNGCPDRDADGVADKVDNCPDEYGELRNGCPVAVRQDSQADTTLKDERGLPMAPHIVLETDVLYFDMGKAEIKDSALAVLSYAAKVLDRNPNVVIHISGFTDDIGNFRNNLVLSYERSNAARKFLLDNGISKERIIISGYGMDNPVRANDTPENRAKNRRIEMKLLLPL